MPWASNLEICKRYIFDKLHESLACHALSCAILQGEVEFVHSRRNIRRIFISHLKKNTFGKHPRCIFRFNFSGNNIKNARTPKSHNQTIYQTCPRTFPRKEKATRNGARLARHMKRRQIRVTSTSNKKPAAGKGGGKAAEDFPRDFSRDTLVPGRRLPARKLRTHYANAPFVFDAWTGLIFILRAHTNRFGTFFYLFFM